MATVIGPTPPRTGAIKEAFWETLLKSTSPVILPLNLPEPQSITIAPFFTILPFIKFGLPVPEIRISACFVKNVMFFVKLPTAEKVAFSFKSQMLKGFPTNIPVPIKTIFFPLISIRYFLRSSAIPEIVGGDNNIQNKALKDVIQGIVREFWVHLTFSVDGNLYKKVKYLYQLKNKRS